MTLAADHRQGSRPCKLSDLKRVANSPVAVDARSWSESVEAALLADRGPGLTGGALPGRGPCKGSSGAGLGEMVLLLADWGWAVGTPAPT